MIISHTGLWAIFIVIIILMLMIDFFIVGGGKAHRVSVREASFWVITWMIIAFLYSGLIWYYYQTTQPSIAHTKTLEFITGYLIEWSLSVDNLFVFIMIFSYFKLPAEYQRRVLLYGIMGALVFRFTFIILGVFLVSKFHWILYIFGLFLVYSGVKILFHQEDEGDLSQNPLLKWIRKHLRVTKELHEEHFFVKQKSRWYVTPLFVTLIFIEISDVIFALDSIPAIFAVTNDPFIIFTSNTFAIMGLRAMYFLLARMHEVFHFLKHGVALILIFIGCKMLLAYWYTLPIYIALSVIVVTILFCILLSIYVKKVRV